ncbi:hypothetical protein ACHAXT_012509 [Thalassiosira profunda]
MIIHVHVPIPSFLRKRSIDKDRAEEKGIFDIPEEIIVKKSVHPSKRRSSRNERRLRYASEQFDLDMKRCGSPLLLEDSADLPPERLSTDGRPSMDSTSSVAKDLWRSATAVDGPIAAVDYTCKYDSVVMIMSRDEETRKKVLDDLLNHGEF